MPTRSPRRNARSRGRSGRTFFAGSGAVVAAASVAQIVEVLAITAPTTNLVISSFQAGDQLVVVGESLNHDTDITAASGCGATWSSLGHLGATSQGAQVGWIGRNPNANGTIALTFTSSRPGFARAFLLRDVNGTTATWNTTSGTPAANVALAGPSASIALGQLAIAIGQATTTMSFPSVQSPSSAWTPQTAFGTGGLYFGNTAYATPAGAAATHQVSVSSTTASSVSRIAQIIVGTAR